MNIMFSLAALVGSTITLILSLLFKKKMLSDDDKYKREGLYNTSAIHTGKDVNKENFTQRHLKFIAWKVVHLKQK